MATSRAEYLKRYISESDGGETRKKKRKKRPIGSQKPTGFTIVDVDIDINAVEVPTQIVEEEGPTVAEVIDERPEDIKLLEKYQNQKWKKLEAPQDHDDNSPPRRTRYGSDDESPPLRKRHDSEDNSPPLRKGHDSEDNSPPRRKRHDSEDNSPPRRKRHDSEDNSPPRRKRHVSEDNSPPRRKRHDSEDNSPPRRKRHDSKDNSPPRRNRYDSKDNSPPQRKRHDSGDNSLPRKRRVNDSDNSPPRRRRLNDSDLSPPRKRKGSDSDQSPPRKKATDENDVMKKTLSGKLAGLSSAADMKQEADKLKRKEKEAFRKIDDSLLGKNAATVFRDKTTGRRRNIEGEKDEEEAQKKEIGDKYKQWNKGLKQEEADEARVQDMVHEMSKPLARMADDADRDAYLKVQDREGDPMLNFIKKKKSTKSKEPKYPKYNGPAPPNRFNTMPGYRWDGVDRSTGFEKQYFLSMSNRKAVANEAYKWSTEEM